MFLNRQLILTVLKLHVKPKFACFLGDIVNSKILLLKKHKFCFANYSRIVTIHLCGMLD